MDENNFREMYIDEDDHKDEPSVKELMTNEGFDDDVDEEEIENEKKSNGFRKKIILVVFITITVILCSLAALSYYAVYRDDKPPVATSVHIESDNFDDHSVAVRGNMITLTVTFDKELTKPPKIIIHDKSVDVFGEGKEYMAKYFVETQKREKEVVSFSIHDYRDRYNKTGKPITITTDLTTVTILPYE